MTKATEDRDRRSSEGGRCVFAGERRADMNRSRRLKTVPTRPHAGVLDWDEMLSLYAATEPWIEMPVDAYHGFYHAAVEAGALANGPTILAQAVGLNGGLPVSVQYLGEGTCPQGAYFHAFMFFGPTFDALVWTEDDLIHGQLARRGDMDAFQKAEVSLKIYEGRTLAHLRMEDG